MRVSIPPKHSISHVVDYIKGKGAIQIARKYVGHERNFIGQHFWAKGYYLSIVGREEESVRRYIKRQREFDQRLDQLDVLLLAIPVMGEGTTILSPKTCILMTTVNSLCAVALDVIFSALNR